MNYLNAISTTDTFNKKESNFNSNQCNHVLLLALGLLAKL
jgi:hypothetical protein